MNELMALLEKMHGQPCWSMIGPSAGSWFSLDFGGRRKKETATPNDKLRPEQREFRGDYSLFVQMSGWRLFHKKGLICDCNSSNTSDGLMIAGLRQLEGASLVGHSVGKRASELTLTFTNDLRLVLCDWESVPPTDMAFCLFGDGCAISVTMAGEVKVSPSSAYPPAENYGKS